MNQGGNRILTPMLALALFAFMGWQTFGALRASGAWRAQAAAMPMAVNDPLVALDTQLAQVQASRLGTVGDPFGYTPSAVVVKPSGEPRAKVLIPVAPPRPVLTAIVYDNDPRALVRWKDREWTIRAGGLFDDFEVVSISRDQVVLHRAGESIVLQRKPQGE